MWDGWKKSGGQGDGLGGPWPWNEISLAWTRTRHHFIYFKLITTTKPLHSLLTKHSLTLTSPPSALSSQRSAFSVQPQPSPSKSLFLNKQCTTSTSSSSRSSPASSSSSPSPMPLRCATPFLRSIHGVTYIFPQRSPLLNQHQYP